jgi:predicted AlkP superfamily phosphohydrolase/phosphomutase
LLVIGVDGAEPKLLKQWMQSGDLPNLARLQANSLTGSTKNPYALEAGSVWPAFHTGLNPGHQPQFDGLRFFDSQSYSVKWFEADAVVPNLWQHLSSQGKRCLVIDTPYVRLDPTLNGVMVLDWGSHVAANGKNMEFQTHPPELKDELLKEIGPDPTSGTPCDRRKLESIADHEKYISEYLLRIEKKAQLTTHLLSKGGWDFAETVFTDLHCLGHQLWHIHDENHPLHRPSALRALGDPIFKGYCALDKAVGEILDVIDNRTTVLFYVSHGMGPQYTGTGLLDKLLSIIERGTPARWSDRPIKARVRNLWRKVPGEIRAPLRILRKPVAGILDTTQINLDRSTRRFFEVHANNATGGIRLNLKGREAKGIVEIDEARALLREIKDAILDVRNAETGQPIARECIMTNDLYRGPYDSYLPDMLVVWNRAAPIRIVESARVGTVRQDYGDFRTGDHTPFGLFMACGPGIRPALLDEKVKSVDFFSSLVSLLGGTQRHTDGQPIAAFISQGSREVSESHIRAEVVD